MIIYPAIDIIGGKCVRLSQGEFDRVTAYEATPADALARYAEAAAQWAHVVDLDGAKAAAPRQHDLIGALAKDAPLKIQAAGGVRTEDHVRALLDAGVARVVIGSLAVENPALVHGWLKAFGPERIGLALDIRMTDRGPGVATRGWTADSGKSLWDVGADFAAAGLKHMLITDIGKDGMMEGPNFALMRQAVERLPTIGLIASGGVRDAADIRALKADGMAGAIVGKALWDGVLSVKEAVNAGA
jgi:phosphoribosylformimino-5-aminoimidazole carboxamide ribotide isomerase